MLNENGQSFLSLFKPWLSIQNVFLGLAVVFIVALFKLTASELASWVQAVGSIAAILGAFMISHRQLERQQTERDRESKSKAEAFYAVVENAAKYSEAVRELVSVKRPPGVVFIMIWKKYLAHEIGLSIKGLEAMPAHELGSYKLVLFQVSILAGMIKANSDIESFVSRSSFSDQEIMEFYSEITVQFDLIDKFWRDFQEASKQR
ncbi:hypothetical protein SA496_14460 [Pseudomonas sp. JS3066]|uniref:hypothetical protein n=1 Tax=Pseudomonas sp. JS3066 TaxID=3090665 RepID=UPI002E7AF3F3|nr:hypothetical protein [Pseudomonas sp. JS3066]WVK90948.1 hypothetical protein SA496_14460 [Pseudomonas sp. JS3066]